MDEKRPTTKPQVIVDIARVVLKVLGVSTGVLVGEYSVKIVNR